MPFKANADATNSARVTYAAPFAADSRAEPIGLWRVAQDFAPKTYSCMSSGRKDAQTDQAGGRARLPRKTPHVAKSRSGKFNPVKQTSTQKFRASPAHARATEYVTVPTVPGTVLTSISRVYIYTRTRTHETPTFVMSVFTLQTPHSALSTSHFSRPCTRGADGDTARWSGTRGWNSSRTPHRDRRGRRRRASRT